ncbi:MAG: DUF423 domain-containing protein [Gemmatimonadales bacterium]|nr:DUF423 domain-containing protein [Gemmatimonadales bacterium]MYG48416.1 DUF423 domain-containing protein [Gemmatimonadales bacterium]MYK00370.1 DUF423 domain-containing protein [Candidatus Palauibacter ramosifaciens]
MTGADSPQRGLVATGCLLAGLGVAAGAFGAHSLEGRLSAEALATFDTAARYHMWHALGLILLGLASGRWPDAAWRRPGLLMVGGIAVFSGTLYALALSGIGWLGAITPLGGAALIAAWIWAARIAITRT